MSTNDAIEEAIDVLQELGLKEYEAKCFAGLARLPTGTAKELGEITDVPRTRVYDAIRVLEAQGLVEVQHTSPQQFRAVPLEEAMETLRDRYEARIDRLRNALDAVEPAESTVGGEHPQEVWSLSGTEAVENRVTRALDGAASEVVLVIGDADLLTDELVEELNALPDDVALVVGAVSPDLQEQVRATVSQAETYVSGLDWLEPIPGTDEDVVLSRLLLVDRSTLLVSTVHERTGDERAIFGTGFENGAVVVARRLMAKGLLPERDPGA